MKLQNKDGKRIYDTFDLLCTSARYCKRPLPLQPTFLSLYTSNCHHWDPTAHNLTQLQTDHRALWKHYLQQKSQPLV